MNWTSTGKNDDVVAAFEEYRHFILRISTLYAGSRLIEAVDLEPLGHDFKLAISSDFDEGMTTIRTVDELQTSIKSGDYGQLALGLATIQLCTAFEMLFERISEIYSIAVAKGEQIILINPISGRSQLIGNRTLVQIRKLHDTKGILSPLNNDEVLLKLAAIIETRNCLAHAGGLVVEVKSQSRLAWYGISSDVGAKLVLKDNHLDDFLHYMAINAISFVNHAP